MTRLHAAVNRQENLVFELALLALLAGLWGSSYLLIKLAVATIPPVTLIAIRVRWLGAITPLGGLAFLAGWICLGAAAWRAA